jgi:hypothetical protein
MYNIIKKILSKALPNDIHIIVNEFLYEPIIESQLKWSEIFEDTLSIIEDCRICEFCEEIKSNKLLNYYFCSNLCHDAFMYNQALTIEFNNV